jgi:hypothetical protein
MAVGFPPMRPYSHFVVNFPMPASEAGGYRRDATVMWVVWAWRLPGPPWLCPHPEEKDIERSLANRRTVRLESEHGLQSTRVG